MGNNMMKLMKFVLLFVFLSAVYTSKMKNGIKFHAKELEGLLSTSQNTDFYYVFDDWYYAYSPVYYTYTPTSYYYLCEWWWFPSACNTTYVVFRANQLKQGESLNASNKIEIKELRKEIYGNENFSTREIRMNSRAYDPRWLLAQLKISRILFLEDEVAKNKK